MKLFLSLLMFIPAGCLTAGPILYSIGADDFGNQRRVTQLDPNGLSATALFDLGDGSTSFSGLTFDATLQLFYAVSTDFSGDSSLVSFGLSGSATQMLLMTLSTGGLQAFNGGLSVVPGGNYFVAIANDGSPDSEVYAVDVSGNTLTQETLRLGPGYSGGLTLNPADGFLYAIRNDEFGSSSLMRFDLSGPPGTPGEVAVVLADFGVGFYGGLVPDGNGGFYVLGTDAFGASTLGLLDSGGTITPSLAAGFGFYAAGLTAGPLATPEPGTFALWLGGIGGLAVFRRRISRRDSPAIRGGAAEDCLEVSSEPANSTESH